MSDDHYKQLNADLGFEFHLYTLEHPEWVARNIPPGAIVVMQIDDPGFNAWARKIAEINRATESPARPLVLVHIRELLPDHSRIVRADVEPLARRTTKVPKRPRRAHRPTAIKKVEVMTKGLHVVLSDAREIIVPWRKFPRLRKATPAQRKKWRVIGRGVGIHWEDIDEDISVEGLLAK